MGLGKNLKEILKQKNMTIKDLSEKTGISANTLYSITKRDGRTARFDIIKKICSVLGVSESDLLGFDIQPEDYKTKNNNEIIRVYEVHKNSDSRNKISNPKAKSLQDMVLEILKDAKSHYNDDSLSEIEYERYLALILSYLDNLNESGQKEVIKQLNLLSKIPEYRKEDDKQE